MWYTLCPQPGVGRRPWLLLYLVGFNSEPHFITACLCLSSPFFPETHHSVMLLLALCFAPWRENCHLRKVWAPSATALRFFMSMIDGIQPPPPLEAVRHSVWEVLQRCCSTLKSTRRPDPFLWKASRPWHQFTHSFLAVIVGAWPTLVGARSQLTLPESSGCWLAFHLLPERDHSGGFSKGDSLSPLLEIEVTGNLETCS